MVASFRNYQLSAISYQLAERAIAGPLGAYGPVLLNEQATLRVPIGECLDRLTLTVKAVSL
jgi:hypothetical protein